MSSAKPVTPATPDSSTANVKAVCEFFQLELPSETFFPNTLPYKTALESYFSAQEQALNPTCMVSPTTSAQVSLVIKTLGRFNVKFAVRGGGHTLNAGAANIASGVTINLRSMNQVTVNAGKTFVSVGGGAKWGEVYPVLDAVGLATSGGRVSDVGVGGLSLGGGISYFSARKGLVCDNILSYEVVLANGDVVEASANSNQDLWHALKGGSSNFGIVTRFDIATFPQGDFYGGVVASGYTTLSSQLAGYSNLLANYDPDAALIMSISWNAARGGFNIFSNIEYTQNVTNPAILQPFTLASPQFLNTMRISNVSSFAAEASTFAASGLRNQFATTTFGGPLSMLTTVQGIWSASIPSIAHIAGINWAMSIQPWPQAYDTESREGNSLGLSASNGPLTVFLLSYSWSNASNDAAATVAAQALISSIDAATQTAGHYSPFKYLNYAAYWQNPIGGYGAQNVIKLKAASQKYDPSGLFQTSAPGGFKVSHCD